MRLLLAAGTGLIGQHLTQRLVERGAAVKSLPRRSHPKEEP